MEKAEINGREKECEKVQEPDVLGFLERKPGANARQEGEQASTIWILFKVHTPLPPAGSDGMHRRAIYNAHPIVQNKVVAVNNRGVCPLIKPIAKVIP